MSETLFLHYDRAALDAEYDNRAKVAGVEDCIAGWKTRSEEARSNLDCSLDLAYGSSTAETLDIFPSNTPGKSPINVFYHGGIGAHYIRTTSVTWRTLSMRPVPPP